jgi:hypothetical protein
MYHSSINDYFALACGWARVLKNVPQRSPPVGRSVATDAIMRAEPAIANRLFRVF